MVSVQTVNAKCRLEDGEYIIKVKGKFGQGADGPYEKDIIYQLEFHTSKGRIFGPIPEKAIAWDDRPLSNFEFGKEGSAIFALHGTHAERPCRNHMGEEGYSFWIETLGAVFMPLPNR